MTKLSYIVPAYNAGSFIRQTVDGIFALPLSKDELEVIVVDDCSTDNTCEVLKDMQKAHPNLVVLHQERNQRQGAARNRGIDVARGEYIAFCDADDEIVADGVMNALQAVEKSHADICYFDFEYQRLNGSWVVCHSQAWNSKWRGVKTCKSSDYLNDEYTCAYNAPWRSLYRSAFLKNIGVRFVEGVRWEDCDWTVKVYAQAKEIQFVNGVGYRYAWNESATSKQADAQAMAEQLMAGVRLYLFAKQIEKELPGLYATLHQEATHRYVIGNIRLRNLTKYHVADIVAIYRKVNRQDWHVMSTMRLPVWERIVVRHHILTICLLIVACPTAALGRAIVAQTRRPP